MSESIEAKPKHLTVKLVGVGEAENYNLKNLAKKLNKLKVKWLTFKSERILMEALGDEDLGKLQINGTSPYWDYRAALDILKKNIPAAADEYVIGITPGWIAQRPEPDQNGNMPEVGYSDAYFGIFHNNFVRLEGDDVRYAIVSTAPWESRYEKSAYRTVQQYIIHMIAAAVGDYVVEYGRPKIQDFPGLTHASYQSCVFDFTDFPDSIVTAVQHSRICRMCSNRLNKNAVLRINVNPGEIETGLKKLLVIPAKPTYFQVLRALHENPLFSIFALGILLSFIVGLAVDFLSKNHWTENLVGVAAFAACIAALLLIVGFMRVRLTGRPVP